MTAGPAPSPVRSRWHRTITAAPYKGPALTPFHSHQWAESWHRSQAEPALAQRHLLLTDGQRSHGLSYLLSDSSPLWRTLEAAAHRRSPVFSGPVVYAPSLYNQYGGLPGASDLVLAEAVDQGRQLARQWSAPALLVSNLAPAEVAQWTRIRPPDACLRLFNAHRALIGASGLPDFVGRIPSEQARAEFQHQHRCGKALGLRLHTVSGSDLPSVLPDFHTLSERQAQREGRPALYSRAMLPCLPRIPGALALLAEKPDGALAGAFLGFRHGTTLYLWAEGP